MNEQFNNNEELVEVSIKRLVDAVLHMTKGNAEFFSLTDSYSVATYAYAMLNSTTNVKMLIFTPAANAEIHSMTGTNVKNTERTTIPNTTAINIIIVSGPIYLIILPLFSVSPLLQSLNLQP